ncbi:hypothetical protein K5X82_10780 [Halosquirtibacter xylanolyticus]|uniref:hypothetical protein n=1 Tax=Halosquirtibacter xylanolyticus TaxID=3374599 RepID=UPI003748B973|nr:hypothetical protein K5X82_10780 [Prolixibacteraceae bacterium]
MLARTSYNIDSLIESANVILVRLQERRSLGRFQRFELGDGRIKELSTLVGKIEQTDQVMKSFMFKEKPQTEKILTSRCNELNQIYQKICSTLSKCESKCEFMKMLTFDNTWSHIYPYWISSIGKLLSSYHSIVDVKEVFHINGVDGVIVDQLEDKFDQVVHYRRSMIDEMGVNEAEFQKFDKMILKLVKLIVDFGEEENLKFRSQRA